MVEGAPVGKKGERKYCDVGPRSTVAARTKTRKGQTRQFWVSCEVPPNSQEKSGGPGELGLGVNLVACLEAT